LPKGSKQLNFEFGINTSGFPTYMGMDFAVHNNITLGPLVKVRIKDHNDVSVYILGKVDYHWNKLMGIPGNWDFYTGSNIGGRFKEGLYLDLGLQIGGRWYFNKSMGLNLEFEEGRGFGILVEFTVNL